jgi:transglutaminase/protease-like cytokinesis protein 3
VISIRTILFCVFLLVGLGTPLNAQIGGPILERAQVQRAKTPFANTNSSNKKLALRITKNCTGDLEKSEAIFKWIATHISYDHELRNDVNLQQEFYTSEKKVIQKVLERKKGLCGGYAFLFKDLCKQVGVQSELIHGYSKKYYQQPKAKKNPDHTWNVVKINNSYHLLDLTLAVSHGNENGPDMYWFRTDPIYFIKTHYPEDKKWTLMLHPSRKSGRFGEIH